jgi:putative endonuclease
MMKENRTTSTLKKGREGEECAMNLLKEHGFAIVARGFRSRFGEIDIVAQRLDLLLFVEVKTRSSETFGSGAMAVDPTKQKKLIKTALYYLATRGSGKERIRFDVIEVELAGNQPRIKNWYQGAFTVE